jgi:hypothetical protein
LHDRAADRRHLPGVAGAGPLVGAERPVLFRSFRPLLLGARTRPRRHRRLRHPGRSRPGNRQHPPGGARNAAHLPPPGGDSQERRHHRPDVRRPFRPGTGNRLDGGRAPGVRSALSRLGGALRPLGRGHRLPGGRFRVPVTAGSRATATASMPRSDPSRPGCDSSWVGAGPRAHPAWRARRRTSTTH